MNKPNFARHDCHNRGAGTGRLGPDGSALRRDSGARPGAGLDCGDRLGSPHHLVVVGHLGFNIAAPTASAAVTPGEYTFTTVDFGIPSSAPASVQGNNLVLFSPVGPLNLPIVDVPGGGFVDFQGQRYFLGGETFFGPFVIGHSVLSPR